MINTIQAAQLKELIEAYRTATESYAFKGSQPPADAREIELDLYDVKRQLDAFVAGVTAPTDSIAVPTSLRQAKAMMAVASMFLEEHAPKPAASILAAERDAEFLNLAEQCGARITGKPNGSEPIEIVFSIEAWRRFATIQELKT